MERYLKSGDKLKLKGINGHFVIRDIIGRGSSCVVYSTEFYNENGDKSEHLLKEFNPKCIDLDRKDGILKPLKSEDKKVFDSLCKRFKDGFDRQADLRALPELKNYTANIQNIYYDYGTMYIDMTETEGRSYTNVEEKSLYNLAQRIRVLAQVVGNYHKQGFLHLDIKPSNTFVRPEDETCQDVLLFDFDSLVPFCEDNGKFILEKEASLSYTTEYAPIELVSESRRHKISKATDIYEIGEIFFEKLMGRHSTALEHNAWADYRYNLDAPILENVNPKAYPLLDELFHRTLCNDVLKRYQTSEELCFCLDKIIELSNPKEPFLKSSLPNISGFFTGRDAEIEEIHKRLQENNVLFLSGIGGIGKSELAKHYADKYKDSYDAIIFAPFVNDVQMMIADDNYVPIYNFSQYPDEKSDEYFARKIRKLSELCDKRTLIIVDNLDTMEDKNLDKLFKIGCKMVVTTRIDLSDVYPDSQIDLGVLSNPFAVFEKYYTKSLSEEQRNCVDEIIEIVCGHTMTVELLAKQMMAGRVKPQKMLENMKIGGISESGKEKVRSVKDGILSVQSIHSHIQALFDLSELNEDEQYILSNLSLIPYTGIADAVFHDWCELRDYCAINNLISMGFVLRPTSDSISLHPIILESIIVSAIDSSDTYSKMLTNAKEWVSDINLRQLDSSALKSRSDMVLCIAKRLLSFNIETEEVATFLNRVPTVFWKYGKLTDAIACRERALQIRIHLLGEVNSDTASSYFNLGRMYKESDDYETAEKYYNKALEIRRVLFGEEHEDTATCYNALGVLYKEKELFDAAEDYIWRALRSRETLLGEKDEDVAISYNCLAVLYRDLKRFEESEQYHLHALEIRKYLFGEIHEDVAASLNNLGMLYKEWKKLNESENYFLKALETWRCIFGDMHSSTATTYANLGDLYRMREEFGSAKRCYQKAFEIRTMLFGENHRKTMRIRKRIAKLPEGPTRFDMLQDRVRITIQKILEDRNHPQSTHFSKERCPDQIVAKICVSMSNTAEAQVEFLEFLQTKTQRQSPNTLNKLTYARAPITSINVYQELPRIVLVLESPHKKEFNPNDIDNPVNGPAYGTSGDNINQYLPQMLKAIMPVTNEPKCYEIVLVNAIQYQCSLGEVTTKYRDRTFWECWQCKEVRLDFRNRIEHAIGFNRKECIIINCCTTGRTQRSNHALINIMLDDIGFSFFECTHPSSWRVKKNRVISKHVSL